VAEAAAAAEAGALAGAAATRAAPGVARAEEEAAAAVEGVAAAGIEGRVAAEACANEAEEPCDVADYACGERRHMCPRSCLKFASLLLCAVLRQQFTFVSRVRRSIRFHKGRRRMLLTDLDITLTSKPETL